MDRIFAHAAVGKSKKYYVKWQQLPYNEATWEYESDIQNQEKIDDYNHRITKIAPLTRWKDKVRPSPASFKPYESSPVYKSNHTLRPYQLEGLNWLRFCWLNRRNSILADEMGLGKTVQTVSIINYLFTEVNLPGPYLIIAPLITIPHWQREFEGWTKMSTVVYHGTGPSREIIRRYEWGTGPKNKGPPFKFNVLITTYEMIMTDSSTLAGIEWKYIAVDEAHRLKNKNCKLIGVLRSFKFDHLLLLTGTPLQNNTDELWTLLNLMDKNKFNSADEFARKFGELKETKQVEELHEILKPYILRRMKEDVEKSIAPKEETIVEVELTTIQKRYYRAIFERNFSSLNMGGKSTNVPSLLNVMMQLRKCCNHPYLLKGVEENILLQQSKEEEKEKLEAQSLMIKASGKLVLIDKLLPKLKASGHKVLIFSQMVRMLDILEDYLIYRQYQYERIDGSKKGTDRQAAIDRFSVKNSDKFVFLLCTRAGGLGINLTAADTCIIYDSDWNPQNDIQAQARCHRIGQTQMVKVYRLLTRNTYETAMFEKASKKLGLDQAVLNKMKSVSSASAKGGEAPPLKKKEVEQLLKYGAYGAFDETGKDKYDEEDIDKILERSKTIVVPGEPNSEENKSSFSKAAFISAEASSNAHIDVNDPDFWKKLMPDKKSLNPLIQQKSRHRKKVKRYGLMGELEPDEDGDSESELEEYEDNPDSLGLNHRNGWNHRERVRLKSALQSYGYGQWNTIKRAASLDRWSLEDIRSYSEEFIRRCFKQLEEEDEEGIQYLRSWFFKEKDWKGNEVDPLEPPNDDIPNKFQDDASLNDKQFQQYAKKNAKLLVRRLESIAKFSKIVLLCHKTFGQDFKVPEIVSTSNKKDKDASLDKPCESWTSEDDKSLILGTYYHGYGHFSEMCSDARLSLCRFIYSTPKKSKEDSKNKEANLQDVFLNLSYSAPPQICITASSSAPDKAKPPHLLEHTEDGMEPAEMEEEQPKADIKMEDASKAPLESGTNEIKKTEAWPGEKLVNRRLRKVLRVIAMELAQQEIGEDLEECTFDKGRKGDKKRKGESQNEWSKREKLDFYRVITSHGIINNLNGETDWSFFQQKAKLTRKTIKTIESYCKALINQSEQAVLSGKDYDNQKKIMLSNAKESELEKQEGDWSLSLAQCKRVLQRVKMFKEMREKIMPMEECLPEILKGANTSSTLPKYWKPSVHDAALLKGVCKHGFGQWEKICSDPELPFYHLASEKISKNQKGKAAPDPDAAVDENDEMDGADDDSKKPRKRGRQVEVYTNAIDFPKEKVLTKRLEYLVKYLTQPSIIASFERGRKRALSNRIRKSASLSDSAASESLKSPQTPGENKFKAESMSITPKKSTTASTNPFDRPNAKYTARRSSISQKSQTPTSSPPPALTSTPPSAPSSGGSTPTSSSTPRPTIAAKCPRVSTPTQSQSQSSSQSHSTTPTSTPKGKTGSTPKQEVAKFVDVPRDENNKAILPIKIGKMRIECLGTIIYDPPTFHSSKYIWPVGFKSVREYQSFINPEKRVDYTSEILDGGEKPIFSVTASDAPTEPFQGASASGVWGNIIKRVNEVSTDSTAKRVSNAVSGPENFGFAKPIIKKVLFFVFFHAEIEFTK